MQQIAGGILSYATSCQVTLMKQPDVIMLAYAEG